ncbi:MAG: MFS transporter, partial [Candidatus Methanomethylophilaceae archaeon]|nr:MFS transporter [Candidatus Methanomethylophilaceae archaeon]
MKENKINDKKALAMRVIILFGIVSLFGDVLYEGARSANGQYLELLGVSATILGLVYGIGEFLGYALRLISGYISDKTGRQWTFIFFGYTTLIVVPMMGLTSNWQIIVVLILLERVGKGLRSPPKDTILSQVAEQGGTGMGRAFGIQEALDQIGALSGPLVFSIAFLIS